MPAEGRENHLLKKGNSDAFFREKYLTKNTQRHHAAQIVMSRTADHASDGNGDERDGAEQNALNGAENGACSCDIEQIDQRVLEFVHWNVVHAILQPHRRSLSVIRAEYSLHKLAV